MSKANRKNLKLAIVGAKGRMGAEVIELASAAPGFQVVAELDIGSRWMVKPSEIDVVIDFSQPKGTRDALKWCARNGRPLVSGTTGLGRGDVLLLRRTASRIPILYSGNMSLGVAVMSAMIGKFSAVRDWDFQISEVHHSQKKDRPSGTALLLETRLASAINRRLPPVQSTRGGGVPGIHEVLAMGPDEVLTIRHTAFDRRVFARGALRAARWLFDKGRPGLYDLSDLYET